MHICIISAVCQIIMFLFKMRKMPDGEAKKEI